MVVQEGYFALICYSFEGMITSEVGIPKCLWVTITGSLQLLRFTHCETMVSDGMVLRND